MCWLIFKIDKQYERYIPGFILKVLMIFSLYAIFTNFSIASYQMCTLSIDTGNFESLWCSLKLILLTFPYLSSLYIKVNRTWMFDKCLINVYGISTMFRTCKISNYTFSVKYNKLYSVRLRVSVGVFQLGF